MHAVAGPEDSLKKSSAISWLKAVTGPGNPPPKNPGADPTGIIKDERFIDVAVLVKSPG